MLTKPIHRTNTNFVISCCEYQQKIFVWWSSPYFGEFPGQIRCTMILSSKVAWQKAPQRFHVTDIIFKTQTTTTMRLPLFQWIVLVSQWLSTLTWPGQTCFTSEFTSLPKPCDSWQSLRNIMISLEQRGYLISSSLCLHITSVRISGYAWLW